MGNWLTDTLDALGNAAGEAGDAFAGGLEATTRGLNVVDRFINPFFHQEFSPDGEVDESRNAPYADAFTRSSERFFQGYEWVYDNAISQPISTGVLMIQRPGQILSPSEWARTWRASEFISPGQAFQLPWAERGALGQLWGMASTMSPIGLAAPHLFGDTGNAQQAVDSPLIRYAPPGIERMEGWGGLSPEEQQQALAEMGMPVDPMGGNAFIAQLRQQSLGYRYFSGTTDFAVRWFADPLVIAGKGVSAARAARSVKVRPGGGWSPGQIDDLVNNSRMNQLVDFLTANRDNPALVNNTDMALRSSMGPRLGAVNSILTSSDEVRDFIRVGLGDVAAQERLMQTNALARQRLDGYRSRVSILENNLANWSPRMPANSQAVVRQEVDRLNTAINADDALVTRYNAILEHADEIDRLHLSRGQYRAARARTEAQRQYSTGPARGAAANTQAGREFRRRITPVVAPAGTDLPVDTGLVKTRLWGIGDAFSLPVTMVRMLKNVKPNGYLELDNGAAFSTDNVAELRGQLARIPGLTGGQRQNLLNRYLKTTTEGERRQFLDELQRAAMARIAEKHGLTQQAGEELWEATRARRGAVVDNLRQYSTARMDRPGQQPIRVDVFEDGNGVLIDPRPHTVSRLVNNYILDDLEQFDRVVRRNASRFRALRESAGGARDWTAAAGESLNQYWKFATLLRLGYIPRTLGDDIASQWAALGTASMAMRIGYGAKNTFTNAVHRSTRGLDVASERMRRAEVQYADEELGLLRPQEHRLAINLSRRQRALDRAHIRATDKHYRAEQKLQALPANADPRIRAGLTRTAARLRAQMDAADQARQAGIPAADMQPLIDLRGRVRQLEDLRDLALRDADDLAARQQKRFQGGQTVTVDGVQYPAALAGSQRGEYWMQRISPGQAYDKLFKTNRQLIHANLVRSFDNGARPISAVDDEVMHADAWAHAINAQIAGDQMQRMLVAGTPDADVVRWLKNTPEGQSYWRRLGVGNVTTPEDIVARGRFEVDEYLPLPEIRQQALTPEGVSPEFLRDSMEALARPDVHMGQLGQAGVQGYQAMNRIMQRWYDMAVNIPAKTMSRHPLFNQLYEGHLRQIVSQRTRQGARPSTVEEVERVAETARRIAHRDMRRMTFDISHQTDAAAALRFISPFFSATAESFQRWARIIGDKPEILGYAAKFYNAPAYTGHLQTSDGNDIFPDGTFVDPVTGERKLAPKGDRWIVGRMPEWLANSDIGLALGVERSSGNFRLSQNSINQVTQGDPWYNPGVGPIVQIPVNEFVKDKPSQAELARHLGILPFGPNTASNPLMRTAQSAAPSTVRNFLTAFDTSDYRYQQIKMQITQRAIFEHEQMNKPMPSAQEIADQTRNYWMFSAASSFIQPMATQRRDAYEFYRQQFRNLQRQNPETADLEFLNRFGEEYFIFAQSMSKHEAGVPATRAGVELSQQYADILAENPELGSLIIGPEGQGPFSPEAYSYQLNTPLEPGDAESQRRRLTAREAMDENRRRLGWAQYTAFMNGINAELVNRNLVSLDEPGAEDLAATRTAMVAMLAEPVLPDGAQNPFYNEQFSQDWFSFDSRKYERLIPALERVSSEMLERDPDRSDLRTLQTYLAGRRVLQETLATREFSTLGAQGNTQLRRAWSAFVGQLVESDTNFGDLHSRYLSRDLGIDVEDEMILLEQEGAAA
ncbi:hypothetical protein [Streptomyces sp. MP131-18]|uniref:hypothetical protein n=1 Tax=Streptomyces sp. MP131-18 TaxID=1857892 RepID=UPI00097CB12B|nr:hypothetical protein [Streptomyces sp. MP131-18]ONK10383.1 hypothetical protein STBA_11050 [Streptomyces sp. MP131-18]